MNRYIISILVILAAGQNIQGQGTLNFLNEVSSNHPLLKSYEGNLEVSRAESAVGNTPDELALGYGYFPGTPDAIGTKQTISVTQSFEFPTNYSRRGKLNKETFAVAETEYSLARIQTLLDARTMAYEYIALKDRLKLLEEKLKGYSALRDSWSELLIEGSVTRQDFNRLNLELSVTTSEISSVYAELKRLAISLDYISGGNSALLDSIDYDQFPEPDVSDIDSIRQELHPAYTVYDREYTASQRELSLSRSGNLPDIEVGYGSEIIAGARYSGPTVGLSVPLWTNRNQVKLANARSSSVALAREAAHSSLKSDLESQYESYKLVKQNYSEVLENYSEFGDLGGLEQALSEKEITISEYFSYIQSVYNIKEVIINLRKEYNTILASLYDYLLTGI